jgi:hypothetical protein
MKIRKKSYFAGFIQPFSKSFAKLGILNLHSSRNINRLINSRRMRLVHHVVGIGDKRWEKFIKIIDEKFTMREE